MFVFKKKKKRRCRILHPWWPNFVFDVNHPSHVIADFYANSAILISHSSITKCSPAEHLLFFFWSDQSVWESTLTAAAAAYSSVFYTFDIYYSPRVSFITEIGYIHYTNPFNESTVENTSFLLTLGGTTYFIYTITVHSMTSFRNIYFIDSLSTWKNATFCSSKRTQGKNGEPP